LTAMGHDVVLMPAIYIKPYVKRGKNDALDAAAVCEAMSRPDMRFVPVKSADQQAVFMAHKTRELMVKQRTMCVNALRGHLAEFGLIAPKGVGRVAELIALADADASLPEAAKAALKLLAAHLEALDRAIDAAEDTIEAVNAASRMSELLDQVPGVGPLIASAIAASVPDPGVLKSGRDFAAWLGLTPRQHSSGGKERLGAITKKSDRYLRKMLVAGCTSALRIAGKRTGALAGWIAALRARKPERLVAVALANKLARICWAIMTTGEVFRQEIFAKA
jgi:transposase